MNNLNKEVTSNFGVLFMCRRSVTAGLRHK